MPEPLYSPDWEGMSLPLPPLPLPLPLLSLLPPLPSCSPPPSFSALWIGQCQLRQKVNGVFFDMRPGLSQKYKHTTSQQYSELKENAKNMFRE